MSTDTRLLMGEVIEDPEGQEKNIETLMLGFLKALIAEQQIPIPQGPERPLEASPQSQESK